MIGNVSNLHNLARKVVPSSGRFITSFKGGKTLSLAYLRMHLLLFASFNKADTAGKVFLTRFSREFKHSSKYLISSQIADMSESSKTSELLFSGLIRGTRESRLVYGITINKSAIPLCNSLLSSFFTSSEVNNRYKILTNLLLVSDCSSVVSSASMYMLYRAFRSSQITSTIS